MIHGVLGSGIESGQCPKEMETVAVLAVGAADVEPHLARFRAPACAVNEDLRSVSVAVEIDYWDRDAIRRHHEEGPERQLRAQLDRFDLIVAVVWALVDGTPLPVAKAVRIALEALDERKAARVACLSRPLEPTPRTIRARRGERPAHQGFEN